MKVLFDQGTPVPLRRALPGHEISTAFELGWGDKQNGDLLKAAEIAGFEVIVTTDQNLRYQQNLSGRKLAVLVLMTTNWRTIEAHAADVGAAISGLKPGAYRELEFRKH